MDVFDMIAAQQPTEHTAVWAAGEQLKDILRAEPQHRELVAQDLEHKDMGLAALEKKLKAYADKHRTGSFACVTPAEAEKIIRDFYGMDVSASAGPATGSVVDLSAFF